MRPARQPLHVGRRRAPILATVLLVAAVDAVESGACPEDQGFTGYGRGSHEAVWEGVFGEDFEFASGFDDRGLALLAEEVDSSVGVHRRCTILAADSLLPDHFPGLRVQTSSHSGIVHCENQAVDQY